MYKFYFSILLIISIGLCSCKKDKSKLVGSCSGTVLDQYNQPVANATVTVNSNPVITAATDFAGTFSVSNVSAGQVSISVSATNFISGTKSVTIAPNANTEVDFSLKTGVTALSVSIDSISVTGAGITSDFNISSNAGWTITNIPSWITGIATTGQGNLQVLFTAAPNPINSARSAILTISAGALIKKVKIIQPPGLLILSATNGTSLITDSVSVLFNQPVKVVKITPGNTLCEGDNGFTYFNGNNGVKFHYGCGVIGGSYPFTITVTDGAGTNATLNFTAQFYTQKFNYIQNGITAVILSFMMNNGFWAAESPDSDFPNILAFYSIPGLSVTKKFNFNFRFSNVAYNSYDQLFYLIARGTDNIYVVSPSDGSIVKTITLTPLAGDDPTNPQIYPGETIAFFANGKGIFAAGGQNNYNNVVLKAIDTKAGDVISNLATSYDLSQQLDIKANFNGTEIYTHDLNNGSTMYMIDSQTLTVKSFMPPDAARIGAFIPNLYNNYLLYEVYAGTYLYNPLTKTSTLESTLDALCNFTNRPGLAQTLYMFDDNNMLYINDFANQKTLYQYPTLATTYGDFGEPYATTDGKYVMVNDGDARTLYLFDARCFFGN